MDILSGRPRASAAGLTLENYMGRPGGLTTEGSEALPIMPEEEYKIMGTANSEVSNLVGPLSAVNPVLGAALAIGTAVVNSNQNRVAKAGQKALASSQRANVSMYEDLAEGQSENQRMLESARMMSNQYI